MAPHHYLHVFRGLLLLLSAIGLRFLKIKITVTRARTSDTDLSTGKEIMTARPAAKVRTIDLELVDFKLDLESNKAVTGKGLLRQTILHPVSSIFLAGVLNVIMGPSGSGKTSLLNAMALRFPNCFGVKYCLSGKMTFNNTTPSGSIIRSICSYVCQDDDALLPSLTVRETLHFAAGLRLPHFTSKNEKDKRAEEVLLKMGLKDCSNNLIGGGMVKGISSGEKRRVSIAIQVLTDPRILLLDEPTSGLDAWKFSEVLLEKAELSSSLSTNPVRTYSSTLEMYSCWRKEGCPSTLAPRKTCLDILGDRVMSAPSIQILVTLP